ncbi:hypothetical protein KSS87_020393 [Heliosperma pusillum]|nr:hypothetical protein KSS87_020393 [Heliosperma pusillum]
MSVMSSCSSPPGIRLFFLVVTTAFLISPMAATDHIVGANKGWNAGINYISWANNQTFFVGDFISFRYKKTMHNVLEVNKTGYEKCVTEGAMGNYSNGKDFIQLNKPGKYYFICGIGGCSMGMKVSIVVHALPPPPPTSTSVIEHSATSTTHSNSALSEKTTIALIFVLSFFMPELFKMAKHAAEDKIATGCQDPYRTITFGSKG